MRALIAVAALALLCTSPGIAFGQTYGYEDTIDFAGVRLKLGMPQADAAAALSGKFQLTPQPEKGTWLIVGNAGPVGALTFVDNRLKAMHRYWQQDSQQPSGEFANRLYSALAALTRYNGDDCAVRLSQGSGPGSGLKAIEITCDGKSVRITTQAGAAPGAKPSQPALAQIDEIAESFR